jgi:hypothetical protein
MAADADGSPELSRRLLFSSLALLGPAARALPQASAPAEAQSNIEQVREQARRNREALAKVEVARHVEPAFRFEA